MGARQKKIKIKPPSLLDKDLLMGAQRKKKEEDYLLKPL